MPRVDDLLLSSVVYVFKSAKDAEENARGGGTGFLVAIPSVSSPDRLFPYVVTASHVIREGEGRFVRFNRKDEGCIGIQLDEHLWLHHPDGDDVAVAGPLVLDWSPAAVTFFPVKSFLSQDVINQWEVGPGDEVTMIGRFSEHDGREKNLPSVRFGNIAMMPIEKIKHGRGTMQEGFLVEMRSMGGYSGSPVYLTIPNHSVRPSERRKLQGAGLEGQSFAMHGEAGPWLLGVDFGHLPIKQSVFEIKDGQESPTPHIMRINSGLSGVVPAWRLSDLLMSPDAVAGREEHEEAIRKELGVRRRA